MTPAVNTCELTETLVSGNRFDCRSGYKLMNIIEKSKQNVFSGGLFVQLHFYLGLGNLCQFCLMENALYEV